ncbi:hypothetical protein HU200_049886 [Digitaria exilis]|uniref:NAC domain-containing protein n=1 Tax=Digitaria exilis TaxID=1010633 RepID=A0A835AXW1_9POAL|nr:hypothetical protein HU200_049886 [Digitaria exilis]CAB3489019.1 unnamed protein product [Digitaria exilis]
MESPGPEVFSLGFRFDPKPLDVVSYYLPHLIAGAQLHVAMRPFVHDADVYAGEPSDLARMFRPLPKTGQRFFFTSRKLQPQGRAAGKKPSKAMRAAGAGSWHSQGSKDVLNKDNEKVGEVTKLRYKKGGKYTDWLMEEYSCGLQDAIVGGDRQLVFCNIYVSPRAHQDSVAYKESAAFFAPPPPSAPVVVMAQAAAPHKRQVPEIASPPCPKRMRIAAVAPSHPVAQPPRPCVLQYGVAPPSSTPSVSVTRPSPASVAQPPAPAPTRLATQAPAPPRPLGQPKQQQQMPPATPPVARASPHMPVQAPACHCRPQASVQRKHKILDPFEAMTDDADDEGDDLAKSLEDALAEAEAEDEAAANSEGSPMSFDDMVQLLEKEIVLVPKEEILDPIA